MYQMVARGHCDNKKADRSTFYDTMQDARNMGLIDWDAIYEEGRPLYGYGQHDSPAEAIDPDRHQRDWWADLPVRLEVWVEKAARLGTLQRVCRRYRIWYTSGEGFSSTRAMKEAGDRFRWYRRKFGQAPVLLYLGDHDPSGVTMDEDIYRRLHM